jgi:small conductance mechanosensitive channel
VNSVGTFVIVFWALFSILDKVFDVNVGPLLASAGIAGLAIGFGAQTLVKDFINGFFILVEDEYGIGDVVKIAGVQGTVEDMTLRRTVLRDPNGTLHSVPNSEIHIISNLTRDWAQVAVHVAVDYSEDSDRVINILKEVGADLRNDPRFASALVADPEVPGIDKVEGSQVDYLVVAKVRPGQQHDVQRELRRRIKECLQKNKVKPGGNAPTYILANPTN